MIDFVKKMQTSKLITWLFLWFYLFALIGVSIFKIKGFDIAFILDYLQQIVLIIIISYFSKSTVENFEKIRINLKNNDNN
jgi:hypothetical protein